jgi:hypothetical protein
MGSRPVSIQHPTGPAGAAQRTNEKNETGFAKFASTRTRPGDPRTAMDEPPGRERQQQSLCPLVTPLIAQNLWSAALVILLPQVWEREKYG